MDSDTIEAIRRLIEFTRSSVHYVEQAGEAADTILAAEVAHNDGYDADIAIVEAYLDN
jgi:hypothetical protein